ncbi:hypothetical protein JG687_00012269 [Phytophthora cactorum]|uniref:RxLR effector protein n=1 Tax=Phytophthora cactorum TaxID=29920 RepID=A0A8T1U6X4_9STRA|nr:hypothetical protein JG687_00012269 [Phytophthora cactorum]
MRFSNMLQAVVALTLLSSGPALPTVEKCLSARILQTVEKGRADATRYLRAEIPNRPITTPRKKEAIPGHN